MKFKSNTSVKWKKSEKVLLPFSVFASIILISAIVFILSKGVINWIVISLLSIITILLLYVTYFRYIIDVKRRSALTYQVDNKKLSILKNGYLIRELFVADISEIIVTDRKDDYGTLVFLSKGEVTMYPKLFLSMNWISIDGLFKFELIEKVEDVVNEIKSYNDAIEVKQ